MVANSDELVWHDDGHRLWLEMNRDSLVVLSVFCPNPDGACHNRHGKCVVVEHLDRYGLECHVGQCPPDEHMIVAWSVQGDMDDPDDSQVWIISTTDSLFSAWRSTQIEG